MNDPTGDRPDDARLAIRWLAIGPSGVGVLASTRSENVVVVGWPSGHPQRVIIVGDGGSIKSVPFKLRDFAFSEWVSA